jgi:hypothetical protein
MIVGKKLLVIFGIAAVAGYLLRDRIAAGALTLVEKANGLFTEDESEGDLEYLETRNER